MALGRQLPRAQGKTKPKGTQAGPEYPLRSYDQAQRLRSYPRGLLDELHTWVGEAPWKRPAHGWG